MLINSFARISVVAVGIALLGCSNAVEIKGTKQELPPLALPLTNRLVFGKGDSIVTTLLDGSDLRRLSLHEEVPGCPALSPDSRSIVFASTQDLQTQHWSVFLMQANGTERSKVADVQGDPLCPVWSSDGNYIAFEERFTADTSNTFYVYSSDGRQEAKFTALGSVTGFSPRGDRLVYWVDHGVPLSVYGRDLYTVNIDGSDSKWIAAGGLPSWAKNVDVIAFECDGLCLVAGDGSQLRKIVNDRYVLRPSISPDGKLIAYACTGGVLCIVGADGTPVAKVSDALAADYARFRWNAESRAIAYECEYVTGGSVFVETRVDICTVNADGTGFRNITNDEIGDAHVNFSISMP